MWRWLANLILRNRFVILGAIVLVTIFLGYKAFTSLELDNKYGLALPKDAPETKQYVEFKEMFGEDGGTLVIALETDSLFTMKNFQLWRKLGNEILTKFPGGVSSVTSEATLPFSPIFHLEHLGNGKLEIPSNVEKTSNEWFKNQDSLNVLKDKIRGNPLFRNVLYSKDEKVTLMLVNIEESYLSNKDSCNIVLEIEEMARFYEKDLGRLHFTGLPYIRVVLAKRVQKEMYLFIGLSILITAIVLYIFFRSFKVVGICLSVVSIAVIWAMGNIALIGWKLSFIMALIPPLMIVIGVPNCIFLMTKYHQEIKIHGNKTKALSRVIQKVGTATFLTNLSTALGFLTFVFTNSDRLIEFGFAASINIILVFVISICILPIFLSFQDVPKKRHLKHLDRKIAVGLINILLVITQKYRNYIYLSAGLIIIISIIGMQRIVSTGNLTGDLPNSDNIKKDLKFIESKFGGSIPFEMTVQYSAKNWYTKDILRNINNVQHYIHTDTILNLRNKFSRSISTVDIVKWVNMVINLNDSSQYKLPVVSSAYSNRRRVKINQHINQYGNDKFSFANLVDTSNKKIRIRSQIKDLRSQDINQLVVSIKPKIDSILNPEKTEIEADYKKLKNNRQYFNTILTKIDTNEFYKRVYDGFLERQFGDNLSEEDFELRTTSFKEDKVFRDSILQSSTFLSNFREAMDQSYLKCEFSGTSVIASKGTEYLKDNLLYSIAFAIIFIAVLMSVLFRSWRMVVISMVPNLIPLLITAGIMGFLGIPLKPSTLLVFSIAFGISVDDTIHYLAKYRQELKTQKWNERECVLLAIKEAGIGMFYTSIVLFFGFFVFTFSQFGGTQALGYLVSFTLISAMLCNLIILPSLLLSLNKWLISKSFKEPYFETYDEESDINWNELPIDDDEEGKNIK